MRLVHLADLHLGYRQYQRLTPGGINQREADVARSFERAIDAVIALNPDAVVIAGDIFHSVRPTNPSILHAFIHFSRLRHALPKAAIVMIAGNHDTPRSVETGGILPLFARVGITVVVRDAERIAFPEHNLSIFAVPDPALAALPSLDPDPTFEHNVLVIHGEVEGMLPEFAVRFDRPTVEISLREIGPARWSYVALGHYHVYQQMAPNAYYSGSLDYTSVNNWSELEEQRLTGVPGKGFIERNLATGEHVFHPIPASRPLVDLPPVSARGALVAELDAEIQRAVDGCRDGIDGKIVRLRVTDLPPHLARELDHRAIREYKRRALHFHLDARRPELHRLAAGGAPGRRQSLAEFVREKLQTRVIGADTDREALVALGLHYLREAEAVPGPTAAMAEE